MSRRKKRSLGQRLVIDFAGFGLIILSLLLGWLPGPGGIPMFLAGLGILSLNYKWADRLLQNFEDRYKEFVDRHLVNNKKVSIAIDLAGIILIFAAVVFYQNTSGNIRYLAVGLITFSLFVMISNQRRLTRIIDKFRKKKHKK